jgi:hypothetical protein
VGTHLSARPALETSVISARRRDRSPGLARTPQHGGRDPAHLPADAVNRAGGDGAWRGRRSANPAGRSRARRRVILRRAVSS